VGFLAEEVKAARRRDTFAEVASKKSLLPLLLFPAPARLTLADRPAEKRPAGEKKCERGRGKLEGGMEQSIEILPLPLPAHLSFLSLPILLADDFPWRMPPSSHRRGGQRS